MKVKGTSQLNQHYPFVNTPLPYGYDALEPYIDGRTMQLHHDRHLETYINNLNAILINYKELHDLSLEELIGKALFYPPEIKNPIINNAGGVYNHQFYFNAIHPLSTMDGEKNMPVGELSQGIDQVFGSVEQFKHQLTKAALSVFGSGYAWLIAGAGGRLTIVTTPNQNTPQLARYAPILNVDVWEHAYYLKHANRRADYLTDWFQLINWKEANQKFIDGVL
jgi:Fe-Mn family superoxide dismutase